MTVANKHARQLLAMFAHDVDYDQSTTLESLEALASARHGSIAAAKTVTTRPNLMCRLVLE
ncbi:MAG: hypothetical protein ABIQ36_08905 [Rhodanobacter sp.]